MRYESERQEKELQESNKKKGDMKERTSIEQ
jgi:hypothetical protein